MNTTMDSFVGDYWPSEYGQYELEVAHKPQFPNKVCFDWKAGNCSRYNCKFAHTESASPATTVKKAYTVKKTTSFHKTKQSKMSSKIATLREIRAYVKKVEKMAFKVIPDELPHNIFRGWKHYNFNTLPKKYYFHYNVRVYRSEEEVRTMYAELLDEISMRLKPVVSGFANLTLSGLTRTGVKHDDSMSVTSVNSSSSLNTTTTASVIQEALFDNKCKGSNKLSKATWSECQSDVSSMCGSVASVASFTERLIVNSLTIPVFSAPETSSSKVAVLKYGTVVNVCQRQRQSNGMSWVRTDKGWMLETMPKNQPFLVRPEPGQLLRVKLANGSRISVRKSPVAPKKLKIDPLSNDIVSKLTNGDIVLVMERSADLPYVKNSKTGKMERPAVGDDWIRHAGGWTLLRLNNVEFFERVRNQRNPRAGGNQSTRPVCFNWLRNNGVCTNYNCQYMHAYPVKVKGRDGLWKKCHKHESGTCQYEAFPRACKFYHVGKDVVKSPVSEPASGWSTVTLRCPTVGNPVAAPTVVASTNVPATLMDMKRALRKKQTAAVQRVAESKMQRRTQYKQAMF